MLELFVATVSSWPAWALLVAAFMVVYIENLVPPWPGDVLIVFIGTMIGVGALDFTTALVVTTLGSVLGFASAYGLGRRYGEAIAQSPWVPFITPPLIVKVERWFDKYHGLIIISNRFLAGTRAVIAFVAGIVHLALPRTLIYSAISAFCWNSLLLYVGAHVGSRWRELDKYIASYGWAITGLIIIAVIVFLFRKRKRRTQESAAD